jgi:hypothetical protein
MRVTARLGALSLIAGGVLASASPAVADVSMLYSYSGADYTHRAVEVVPWSADDYGSWVYPR